MAALNKYFCLSFSQKNQHFVESVIESSLG